MHSSVLLIEDNPGDARLVRHALGEASDVHGHRFTVRHVHRLSEGISAAADNVDIVLLDLSLPDSQGLEGFIRLHTALPDLPIVILTGLRDESMAVDALQMGAQDYLSKVKIEAEVVGRSLRFALARKRAENRGMALVTLRDSSVVGSKAPSVREVTSPDGRRWTVTEQIVSPRTRMLVATCMGVRRSARTFPAAWLELSEYDVFNVFEVPIGA